MLTIDSLPIPGRPGLLGLSRCPGSGFPPALSRQALLEQELATVRDWGASGIVTLNESSELMMLGLDGLGDSVKAAGMRWWHCPIPDFGAPGTAFAKAWNQAEPGVMAQLEQGERVLIHCLAGLGRTGTLAARILIEHGLAPDEAIERVRHARPGAIQSDEQWLYLLRKKF